MADKQKLQSFTNTPTRRHTFYCYCTQRFVQDQAIFFLLVDAFRESRLKRQAVFLNDWFIEGNIPQALQDNAYLGIVNISQKLKEFTSTGTSQAISNVGRTFADKRAKHGGGVSGFFGALKQKMGDTKLDGNLFDSAQSQAAGMLGDTSQGFDTIYKPDGTYQPSGVFAAQVPLLRKELKAVNFDPDSLGIY
ncbi:MAG: hypothetical protein BGO05_06855 [Rhizobiales bacterium 63-7]|uniref:hypothetical protein n=1 Tax=Rhizobium sp. YJ-22 TaxID=3037556 RepID=UPI0009282884|nr:hypothetical protein [Rhizobium sp. YJ-22]MBN9028478.1 hypothetical protein [Hyphomicrobiales bacterium]MDG3576895.1 hypothetical protein [Rhizobium sp. YJ-22]OJU71170.1 MAG: hypothetical protein BGO05_06855 [Rhizobiales bacterium 63-7]